jgi:hypothetical protein
MEYGLPLLFLIAIVVVMAGAGRRAEQTKSLLLVLGGIAVVTVLFWLALARAL